MTLEAKAWRTCILHHARLACKNIEHQKGEFLSTAVFSPSTLRTSSFLLNHSTAYHVAMIASIIEYNIENYFFGDYFTNYKLMYIGIDTIARGLFSAGHFRMWTTTETVVVR